MANPFIEAELLTECISLGFEGGPEFYTEIITFENGREVRIGRWDQPIHRYNSPYSNKSLEEYEVLRAAHMVARGALKGFLFRDPLNFAATDQPLGSGAADSAPVQLTRTYSVAGEQFVWVVTKPKAGAVVQQYSGGVWSNKTGTLDTTTGLFTPSSAWIAAAPRRWSGEYFVPVRFESDYFPATYNQMDSTSQTIGLVEAKE